MEFMSHFILKEKVVHLFQPGQDQRHKAVGNTEKKAADGHNGDAFVAEGLLLDIPAQWGEVRLSKIGFQDFG
jgi:hypothetical protein